MKRIIFLLTFFISINLKAQPLVPKQGLVLNLPFTGNAIDGSGNGNHAQFGNTPTLTQDRFGNANSAYSFGGFNDRDWFRIPNSPSLQLTNAVSISFWFKQCSFQGMDGNGNLANNGYHMVWTKAGDGISAKPGLWSGTITNAQNNMTINFNNTNGYPAGNTLNFVGDTTLPCFEPCDWVHMVMVASGTVWKLYVNGKLRKQQTIKQVDFTEANKNDFMIGRMDGGSTIWYPFNGVIDDVNFYNVAVGQPQVDSLFGNYLAPNADKYNIQTPVMAIKGADCNSRGSISMAGKTNGGPYEYSFDGGTTWKTSGVINGLDAGLIKIAMRTSCARWDSTVTIIDQSACCQPMIYFVSPASGNTISTIWRMDTLGLTRTRLFNDSYHRQSLNMNKQGTLLAYTKRKNPNNVGGGDSLWICTSNTDGTNEQLIYLLPEFLTQEIRFLRFNSTGNKLLFHKYHDGWPALIRDGDLYVMDMQTRVITRLTNSPDFAKFTAEWSPDDSKISYSYLQTGWNAFPIPGRLMNPDGSNITVLDPKNGGNYGNTLNAGLSWLPDGSGFVFSHQSTTGGIFSLHKCDINGANPQSLGFSTTNLFDYSFTPDGKRMAMGDNNNLRIMTLTGQQQRVVSATSHTYFRDVYFSFVKQPPVKSNISKTICEGQNQFGYNTNGIYIDTLVSSSGCDSIRTLSLTVLPRKTTTINQSICEGQSFFGYTISGTYRDTLQTTLGCDSIRLLTLTVWPRKTTTIEQLICEGQSFFGYNSSGTYRDTLQTTLGCDSIRLLTLRVLPRKITTINHSICQGNIFLGYAIAGTYRDTLQTSLGCDSIRILNLTVLPQITNTISQFICEGQSLFGYTSSGTYRDTFQTSFGCDSIRVLILTVHPRKTTTNSQQICEGKNLFGYTSSGTYRDTLQTSFGCDSIRVLTLTFLPRKTNAFSQTICEGNALFGYTSSGIYRDTLQTSFGCDSIRVLTLTVLPRKTISINETICEGSILLGYSSSGIYRDTLKTSTDCDSIRVLNLTVLPRKTTTINHSICDGETFMGRTKTGTYRDTLMALNGCDSIIVLQLMVTLNPTPNLGNDLSICAGDSIVFNLGNFDRYLWSNGSILAKLTGKAPAKYWVQVWSGNCTATDTVQILSILPAPSQFLPDSIKLCVGERINLPGYIKYVWSTGETNASIIIKSFGTTWVRVTNSNGCTGSDTIKVINNKCILVVIPNAFSPNGDGINDVFLPHFGQPITNYQAFIFNRWGQQIFTNSDYLKGWDGRWKGSEVPVGVYYYIFRFDDYAGTSHERAGGITLLR